MSTATRIPVARCTGRPVTTRDYQIAYASYDPAATERAPAVITIAGDYLTRPHWRTAERHARAIAHELGYVRVRDRVMAVSHVDGGRSLAWRFTLDAADIDTERVPSVDAHGHPIRLTHTRGQGWEVFA